MIKVERWKERGRDEKGEEYEREREERERERETDRQREGMLYCE